MITAWKTTYITEDFQVGMLIESHKSDVIYQITEGEAYEIVEVYEVPNGPAIRYIDDDSTVVTKNVNDLDNPFDMYFRIL